MDKSSISVKYPKQTSPYPSIAQPAEATSRTFIDMLPIPVNRNHISVAKNQSLKLAIIKFVLCIVIFFSVLILIMILKNTRSSHF